jgi:putative membrane protein
MRRRLILLALAAGAAVLFTALLLSVGAGAVLRAMRALGWHGFALTIGAHLVPITLTGLAWGLLAQRGQGKPGCFIWGRLIRDSAGEALPFSQLGGFVLGARAATLCGVPGLFAAASTVVDVTVELAARLPYMVLGLLVLAWLRPGSNILLPMLVAAVLIAAMLVLFIAIQGHAAALVDRIGQRLVTHWASNGALQASIRSIRGRRRALGAAFLIHVLAWTVSGLEVTMTLWLIGHWRGIGAGIAIDCLVSVFRSISFMIPNAIGVQEGAYVFACSLFGLGPDVALALSLLRRGRDVAIAIPALLGWQALEGSTAWRAATDDAI